MQLQLRDAASTISEWNTELQRVATAVYCTNILLKGIIDVINQIKYLSIELHGAVHSCLPCLLINIGQA
jgi:hypothetical protein